MSIILAELPITTQARFVREAWERELPMRFKHLTGENRTKKMKEAEDCIACMKRIELYLREGRI